ncbi:MULTISPECIES: YoqO family protein [unclassified Bacillus (in: firmicutes)]|uniref:YoqO family protein n=1 Tax=unclassified Bacillus (in: firmicutes) TaxID=185979 RepID=UPI0008EF4F63|nr:MULTISPECIES: YoqO family protein [unclassified Bacillus (in: firmicutes)]SFI62351.1 YoqO-like protein [Bacillus sp. 71mf]SFS43467.1 YoqO-like protein [Bacillus sp. 103mf]
MAKKIGFYGLIGCIILSIILNHLIESNWINIVIVAGIIFALLYRWDDIRNLNKKKKLIFTIEFIILVPTVAFLLIEGQKKLAAMSLFQEWLFLAKFIYIFVILIVSGMIVSTVNRKLSLHDDTFNV